MGITATIDTDVFWNASTKFSVNPDRRACCAIVIESMMTAPNRILLDSKEEILNQYERNARRSTLLMSFMRKVRNGHSRAIIVTSELSQELEQFFSSVDHDPKDIVFYSVAYNYGEKTRKRKIHVTEDKRKSKQWREKLLDELGIEVIWSTEYSDRIYN